MTKLLIVAQREYLQRVRSKGFVIFTVLLPAIISGYILFIIAVSNSGADVASRLAVVDLSGAVYPALRQELADKLPDGRPKYTLTPFPADAASFPALNERLQKDVLAGRFTGYLVIPADVLSTNKAEYHTKNVANLVQAALLQSRLRDAVSRVRLRQAGVGAAQMAAFLRSFDLAELKITAQGETEDSGQTVALAYILGGLLYGALIAYGVTFMRSVVEEKTSRVAEVILSSIDAYPLLMGKILGVGGAALTQAFIWGLFLALGSAYAAAAGSGMLQYAPHVGPEVYLSFVIFFVLGFFVYASLYAAVGAIVSSEQEAQQSQIPITLLLVLAFVLAFKVLPNPGALSAVVLSEIPFFAPILMMVRVTISTPPLWQVLLSWILCAAAVVVIIKFTAKIYRVGLLMTGKRPNLPELLRWLKYS